MAGSGPVREPGLGPLNERWVLAVASELLPGLDRGRASLEFGVEHVVVVAPEAGVVRISRAPGNRPVMERRVELLSELGRAGLPFTVPAPLSEVAVVDGYAAVALSWVPGEPDRAGNGDPAVLRQLLAALRQVDIGALGSVLASPHGYAGGEQWAELMAQAITRLPPDVRGEARRRLAEALALPAVPPSLVHGDLAGANLRWAPDGKLLGVLDWDWASAWDPAIDVACLGWHDWPAVQSAVDPQTCHRAMVWQRTFGLEWIVGAWLRPPGSPDVIERTAAWLRRSQDRP
jgi:aminoglycoside phosphotransferase (APT) family kinase protein